MIIHQMTRLLDPGPGLRYLPEGIQLLSSSPSQCPMMGWTGIQHGPDSKVGSMNFLDCRGQNLTFELPGKHGFFVQCETPGVYMSGLTNEIYVVDFRTVGSPLASPKCTPTGLKISERNDHLINDGVVIANRGILFSTKAAKWLDRSGEQYWVPFDGSGIFRTRRNVQCGNGTVELSASETEIRVAYIDSPTKRIVEQVIYYTNISRGDVANADERVIADFSDGDAFPDGMRPAPGAGEVTHLSVAFFNPGTPDYGVIREIELKSGDNTAEWQHVGAARVTCHDFWPTSGQFLEIVSTTADEGTPAEATAANPLRGCLFSGPTHYPTAHLRQPALVPDNFWQRFTA